VGQQRGPGDVDGRGWIDLAGISLVNDVTQRRVGPEEALSISDPRETLGTNEEVKEQPWRGDEETPCL
jgi:hypothetical protein